MGDNRDGSTTAMAGTIVELWRYPVKSMGGARVPAAGLDERGLHADRLWAVRDLELGTVTTARRLPMLLGCSARFAGEPRADAGPGRVSEVIVTFPDGTEVSSCDGETMAARLSELTRKRVALVPLPSLDDKDGYKGIRPTKGDLRKQFEIADGQAIPNFSMFPVRKLAELARYATPIGLFADAYPLHILTRASLAALAEKTPGSDFDVRRFRPTMILDTGGEPALEENEWCGGVLRSRDAVISCEVPTIRCSVPTREQPGVSADADVVRTLLAHTDRCLGIYADVARGGRLAEGDVLEFEPPVKPGALGASAGRLRDSLKRGIVRGANAAMPKG